MFGYVLPVRCSMEADDFDRYRASYCGVCKQLGQNYGLLSRFFLNYDLVLVAVLADALSGEAGLLRREGCFVNPVEKRPTLHETRGLALAADGLVMLSWHKLRDNLLDEAWPKRGLYLAAKPVLKRMHRAAAARRPEVAAVLEAQMDRQRALEKRGCALVDEACEPTALMCAAIFGAAGSTPTQAKILARLGLFAGQIVYLLDAAEDYPDDLAKGRYNVFVKMGLDHAEAIALAKNRCRMAAGEIALGYNLLDIVQYKSILDNIFFLGLPQGIASAGQKRAKQNRHGVPSPSRS